MTEVAINELTSLGPYFLWQLREVGPYWVLGIVLGSTISVFGKGRIHIILQAMQRRRLGVFGIFFASVLGLLSPLSLHGTIPIAAALSEKGMKDHWLAALMMSSMLLNPQQIIYTAALGPFILTARLIVCCLCGVAAGLLVKHFFRNREFFNFSGFGPGRDRDTDPNLWIRWLKNVGRNIRATGPWFFLGIVLAVLFLRYVPASAFSGFFGGKNSFGVAMAALMGIPLYVCGGGAIPLLLGWLERGMSPGAAIAFTLTGPPTKITNLSAVKIVLGNRNYLIYLAYVFVFALMAGLVLTIPVG